MEKDNAVRNQKVFVRLDKVLALQKRYVRTTDGEKQAATETAQATWRARKEAFEEIIALLELPII